MARYSLFVLKVPLNPKQTNKLRCLVNVVCFNVFSLSYTLLVVFTM